MNNLFISTIILLILKDSRIVLSTKSNSDNFGYCLQQKPSPGLVSCFGRQALYTLQSLEDADNFTITNGLAMIKDDNTMSRSLPNFLDQDPLDFRGILENAGAVISQRTLQWDMSTLYPGLTMRIGPSHGSNGLLEFVMDSSQDRDDRTYLGEEPSTGRILAKQFVVPFLLGLKFNMATLLPLIIGALILLSKKALFLGKIALFLSSMFGFGSLFSLGGLFTGQGHDHYRPNFGGLGSYGGQHHHHDPHLSGGYYKTQEKLPDIVTEKQPIDTFYDYERKVLLRDRASKLYERDLEDDNIGINISENPNGYRNFAWKSSSKK